MVKLCMFFEIRGGQKRSSTFNTQIGALTCVFQFMISQMNLLNEPFPTNIANMGTVT